MRWLVELAVVMVAKSRHKTLVMAALLLGWVGSVFADDQWVLWVAISGSGQEDDIRPAETFGKKADCELNGSFIALTLAIELGKKGYKLTTSQPGYAVVELRGDSIAIRTTCFPPAIDPRPRGNR